eukprot:TRINITY_DN3716_c2_g1_i1.p1 TRINITY_DN3716_c2_g1~~TRINITY_DN3716_c2_g1_i1.p1  ORF type:complete len:774 (+),score=299.10 TRINITY_DN3716_c2_g1_i1:56-2323(+)
MADEDAKAEAAMGGDDPVESPSGGGAAKKDDDKKEDQNRIMVYARLRPVNSRDKDDPNFTHIVNLHPDKKTISLTGGKTYVYDGTFGEKSEQIPVWTSVGKPVVENVFKGYSGCVMAYGQTGTGKSHTMSNMEKGVEGIIMQSMMHVFHRAETDPDRDYEIKMGYLQLYLDKVQDLMKPASGNLDIVRSDNGEVSIPGLVMQDCNNRERFIELYEEGDQHRIVAATKMNPVSSRSHSCLLIQITSRPKGDDGTGETRTAKMWMIDLAGYERFSKTGVLEGIRKEEAKGINASLLSLGNVISALSERSSHIPWRNSKLTRLLQDAIGGKAKASVCITLGPSGASFHETVGTLYFGSRAMAVKTEAKLQLNIDYQALCKKLQAMLEEEQEKNADLEGRMEQRMTECDERETRMQKDLMRLKARHEEQLKQLIASGADPAAIEALMKENEAELDLVHEQHAEERLVEEEKFDNETKEIMSENIKMSSKEMEQMKADHESEVKSLRKQLEEATEEVDRLKKKEEECAQLNSYITTLKEENAEEVLRAKEEGALNSGVSQDGLAQLKKEYDQQVKSIRTMLETTHEGRVQELEENHEKEIRRLKAQLEESGKKSEDEYNEMKMALETKMADEVAKVKAKAADVQERLKKNHMIIKSSYQEQKEKLKAEIAMLKQAHDVEKDGVAAEGKETLRTLTDHHASIKKSYQEQLEKLKRENAELKQKLGVSTGNGTAPAPTKAEPPAHTDPEEVPPPAADEPDDE